MILAVEAATKATRSCIAIPGIALYALLRHRYIIPARGVVSMCGKWKGTSVFLFSSYLGMVSHKKETYMKTQDTDTTGAAMVSPPPARSKGNRWFAGIGALIVVTLVVGLSVAVFAQLG